MIVIPVHYSLDFSAAPGDELIAIGDIHGRADLLETLLETAARIERPAGTRRKLVLLGDLIDRGPASLRSLDLAINSAEMTGADEVIGLIGNHEQMLKIALANDGTEKGDIALHNWIANGGRGVIDELAAESRGQKFDFYEAFGKARLAWLDGLVSHYRSGEILAVHAGVNPDIPLEDFLATDWDVDFRRFDQDEHWAWIRAPFLRHVPTGRGHHGFFVVHGHSTPQTDLVPTDIQVERARLNLDGGSYGTGKARMVHIVGNQATLLETA